MVVIEVAAEEEAVTNGEMLEETLAAAEEVDNSIRDLVLPIRLMLKAIKLSKLIREDQEVKEETEVEMAKSMRVSTKEMVPVEVAAEEAERMVVDLQRKIRIKRIKMKRPKSQPLRKRRSPNLNMKKLFLVKILMISLAPLKPLVERRRPELLRRFLLQLKPKPLKSNSNKLSNKTNTRRMPISSEELQLTTL